MLPSRAYYACFNRKSKLKYSLLHLFLEFTLYATER